MVGTDVISNGSFSSLSQYADGNAHVDDADACGGWLVALVFAAVEVAAAALFLLDEEDPGELDADEDAASFLLLLLLLLPGGILEVEL